MPFVTPKIPVGEERDPAISTKDKDILREDGQHLSQVEECADWKRARQVGFGREYCSIQR